MLQSIKEPIVRWLLLLIAIYFATIALIFTEFTISETHLRKYQDLVAQQRAKRDLGIIIQKHLLLTDHYVHHMADSNDDREVRILQKKAHRGFKSIEKVLAVLSNGGVVEDVMPANFDNVDEIRETIAYRNGRNDGIVLEVVELAPKLADLEIAVNELARLVLQRLDSADNLKNRDLDNAISFRLKTTYAIVLRARECSNKIYYDTSRRLIKIEEASKKAAGRMLLARRLTVGASAMLVAIVGMLTLFHVAQILVKRKQTEKELEKHRKHLEELVKERTAELENAADALRAANKTLEQLKLAAEAANLAKSEFLTNMSHEIRTPMTAILGFVELLLENSDNPENAEAAAIIKRNAEHLLNLINDILDLSKIEAGKLAVEQIDCSPRRILSEVISLMRIRANAKNLPLELEYDTPVPESIRSDPTKLRQILINLMGNAIKFTEVGRVRLVARLLDRQSDEPKMQFEIIDSGIGISEQQIDRLFKPFSQADTSTTRKFGGSGLGLTLSKRLAEMLGGEISVRSTVGKGSTFTVTVATGPLDGVKLLDNPDQAEFHAEPACEPTPRKATAVDGRVLLVEDGPDSQRIIAFMLKKSGADVTLADNGQVACELALTAMAEGRPFDVILMDMQMPVMDGYDATKKLRAEGYTWPIIALTAHAMTGDREKCLECGCDDYIIKPLVREKLITLVAECTTIKPRPVVA